MKKQTIIILLICIALLVPWKASSDDQLIPARKLLQDWFSPVSLDELHLSAAPRDNPLAALARFYQIRDYQPAWVDDGGPLPHAQLLMQTIRNAPADGLRMMDYDFRNPAAGLGQSAFFSDQSAMPHENDLAWIDVALSDAVLRYAAHLSGGRVRPEELPGDWLAPAKPPLGDLPGQLASALNENRLASFMASLSPPQRAYQDLKETLQHYRQVQASGGWPRIAEGSKLRIGVQDARVAALRRHLMITGDLQTNAWMDGDRFDAPLETAVKHYQYRHGLKTDGVVGGDTLAALNTPIEKRMLQLMLNMERWRWFPENPGARYVMVNIPGFELRLVENEATMLAIRAIVGQKSRPTPILSGQLTYLEVNPYWNIPQKIARQDLLPKIQADAGYLTRQGIRVFDSWQEDAPELDPLQIDWTKVSENYFPYRLRQEPAAHNALGRVKFMFPNPQSVYIHDTPGKSLFNQPQRIFSSGCVRVEDPLELAVQLLKDPRWDRRRLEQAVDSDRSRTIVLPTPVPVYLVYFTAWTDTDGDIHFSDDIYGHDRRLLLALLQAAPNLEWCSSIAGPRKPVPDCDSPAL